MHKGRFINYIKKMFSIFILLVVIASVSGFIFVLKIVLASDDPTLKMIIEKEVTTILDNNDDNIVLLEKKMRTKSLLMSYQTPS